MQYFFRSKPLSGLNYIFIYFSSYSSDLVFISVTKSVILPHIFSYFFRLPLHLSVEISVKYLFPLLSSMYQFALLIVRYKGFTLFGVTYPTQ